MANQARDKTHPDAGQGVPRKNEPVPPGATKKAMDEIPLPGGGPPGSDLGDRHAAGTPGGGTEFGGLGGSTVGDGSPEETPLEEAMGGPIDETEDEPPYSGHAGGAVGGTPAEDRSTGGNIHGGLQPGGTHRGDSTLGARPD